MARAHGQRVATVLGLGDLVPMAPLTVLMLEHAAHELGARAHDLGKLVPAVDALTLG